MLLVYKNIHKESPRCSEKFKKKRKRVCCFCEKWASGGIESFICNVLTRIDYDANFHAIRHTFATRCIELGFDVKSLSEILGHASVSITMNRYVHPTMALKTENMNRLSKLFTVK